MDSKNFRYEDVSVHVTSDGTIMFQKDNRQVPDINVIDLPAYAKAFNDAMNYIATELSKLSADISGVANQPEREEMIGSLARFQTVDEEPEK